MKSRKPEVGGWVFDKRNNTFFRYAEGAVLCNFEGHGGHDDDTVEELIAHLQTFDQKAIVTLVEDDESGQMAVFVSAIEVRAATPEELQAEEQKRAEAAAEQHRLELAREKADAILADLRRRKQRELVESDIDRITEIQTVVNASLAATTDPIESEDLRQDLETLAAEHIRLTRLLATL